MSGIKNTNQTANGEKSRTKSFSAVIEAKGEKQLDYNFSSNYCGNAKIILKEILIYDLLGFFCIKQKMGQSVQIGILPPTHLLLTQVSRKTREFIADAEEFSTERSGDDPGEIYQVRPYRPGDSMHSIHWKLTAKEEQLMVKEHGHPLGCVALIWLDLRKPKKAHIEQVNCLMEIISSLSMNLVQEQVVHLVSWFEPQNLCIVKKRIAKEEEVFELLHRLLLVDSIMVS